MIDEQNRIRPHIRLFVNGEGVSSLERRLAPDDEVIIVAALSGGENRELYGGAAAASAQGAPISVAPQLVVPLRSTPLGQANLWGSVCRRICT